MKLDLSEVYGVGASVLYGTVEEPGAAMVLSRDVVDAVAVPLLEAVRDRLDREYNEGYDAVTRMYRNFDESMRLQDVRRWLDKVIGEVREHGDR